MLPFVVPELDARGAGDQQVEHPVSVVVHGIGVELRRRRIADAQGVVACSLLEACVPQSPVESVEAVFLGEEEIDSLVTIEIGSNHSRSKRASERIHELATGAVVLGQQAVHEGQRGAGSAVVKARGAWFGALGECAGEHVHFRIGVRTSRGARCEQGGNGEQGQAPCAQARVAALDAYHPHGVSQGAVKPSQLPAGTQDSPLRVMRLSPGFRSVKNCSPPPGQRTWTNSG